MTVEDTRKAHILIEHKDGRLETLTDLNEEAAEEYQEFMETLADSPRVQWAAWYVPKRGPEGYKARSIFGERLKDRAERLERKDAECAERDAAKMAAIIAARDWTYIGRGRSLGAC